MSPTNLNRSVEKHLSSEKKSEMNVSKFMTNRKSEAGASLMLRHSDTMLSDQGKKAHQLQKHIDSYRAHFEKIKKSEQDGNANNRTVHNQLGRDAQYKQNDVNVQTATINFYKQRGRKLDHAYDGYMYAQLNEKRFQVNNEDLLNPTNSKFKRPPIVCMDTQIDKKK